MKLTKSKLKQIIKEELRKVLQEKLTPAQQRQADYDISKGEELAGISVPAGPSDEDEYRWGFAGDDPVDPEVFQRRPEDHAREKECEDLVYRRLEKLGDDTCMTTNICADVFRSACAQWRTDPSIGKPLAGCPPGTLAEIPDDEAFLECFKKYVEKETWKKRQGSGMFG